MKIAVRLFVIIGYLVTSIFTIPKNRFVAVTSLVGSEKYYIEPWFVFYEDDEIDFTMKTEICADVISSPLFNTLYQVDPLDPGDESVRANLKENYSTSIYVNFYEQANSSEEIVYTNGYRKRPVLVGNDTVYEFMFSCLARNRTSKKITQYFLSRAHLINAQWERHHPDRMKGLFVFDEKDTLVVIAVAEEPGYVISPTDPRYNVTWSSFETKIETANYEEDEIVGSICRLTMLQMIKACTLILTAPDIREQVTFVPDSKNVDKQCHRGVLKFHDMNDTRREDWMIGCKATKMGSNELSVYYISAGFQDQDYFICKEPHREKMILGGIGCRISVSKKVDFPGRNMENE